ncbi:MAG: type VI secretion system-associated protein TagF [Aliishimia sp.]
MAEGFGAFGKIPSMGDFLRLNLSASFVKVWDEWMQRNMLAAQDRLGTAWRDNYLSAPIWRFTMPAHHTGAAAMSGILMASVDRVGRQYPVSLISPHPPGNSALTHFANRPVFERLEALALHVLDQDLGRDDLAARISSEHLLLAPGTPVNGDSYAGAIPAEALLAAEALSQKHPDKGIWTTTMDGDSRMMLCSALPNAQEFLALFDLNAPLWRNMSMAPTI